MIQFMVLMTVFSMVSGDAHVEDAGDVLRAFCTRRCEKFTPFSIQLSVKPVYVDGSQILPELSYSGSYTIDAVVYDSSTFVIQLEKDGSELRRIVADGKVVDGGQGYIYDTEFLSRHRFSLKSNTALRFKEQMWPYYVVIDHAFPDIAFATDLVCDDEFKEHFHWVEENEILHAFYSTNNEFLGSTPYFVFSREPLGDLLVSVNPERTTVFSHYKTMDDDIRIPTVSHLNHYNNSGLAVSLIVALNNFNLLSTENQLDRPLDLTATTSHGTFVPWHSAHYQERARAQSLISFAANRLPSFIVKNTNIEEYVDLIQPSRREIAMVTILFGWIAALFLISSIICLKRLFA